MKITLNKVLIAAALGTVAYFAYKAYTKPKVADAPAETKSNASGVKTGKGYCQSPSYWCNGQCVSGSTICHGTIG